MNNTPTKRNVTFTFSGVDLAQEYVGWLIKNKYTFRVASRPNVKVTAPEGAFERWADVYVVEAAKQRAGMTS
jgi:hypothetical protein